MATHDRAHGTGGEQTARRADDGAGLPDNRDALLALHREWRRRRDASPLISEERAHALEELARIEVHIARIERAMDPPLV